VFIVKFNGDGKVIPGLKKIKPYYATTKLL